MAVPNYVKFQRGTITSYNNLRTKDSNTLYFVYENNDDSKGKLYLGTRLISGSVGEGNATSLNDLADVITAGAGTGSFLVKNSEGNWVAVEAADVAQTIISGGGNFVSIDEDEFVFNQVDGSLELKGYAAASVGMTPVKTASGLSWQTPVDLSSRVGILETSVSSLEVSMQAVDSKIATAVASAQHLKYQVITSLSQATETNTVYLYANNSGEVNDAYNEYMLVNGALEKIGSFNVDLSNYVQVGDLSTAISNAIAGKADSSTVSALDTRVGSLETAINNLGDTYVTKTTFNAVVGDLSDLSDYNNLGNDASISDTLIDIYERLMWVEISE